MKVVDGFLNEFLKEQDCNNSSSTIPVYIFNPSNLVSSGTSHAQLLQSYLQKSFNRAVIVDCAEIEGKTDFFTEIFTGILGKPAGPIPYDFSAFLAAFNAIKPTQDIVLIINNSAQINLSHLDDFVRLWERKGKDFLVVPQLKFVFDDSVSFMGMEARLRDRFRVHEYQVPRVMQVFDELVVDMIRSGFPLLLHPSLMKRFVGLAVSETVSFSSILNQLKFLFISHYDNNTSDVIGGTLPTAMTQEFLFITELSAKLKQIRPSAPALSPANDFFAVCFEGILVDSQAYAELLNELKSLAPNDFVGLFTLMKNEMSEKANEKISSLTETIKKEIVSTMKSKMTTSSSSAKLKDVQLDLIKSISDHLKLSNKSDHIPACLVVMDERGNVRRAFEADPQASLETSLKFPSFYLNCKSSCCVNESIDTAVKSCHLQSRLSAVCLNRPSMPDICLLYRLSLEIQCKSINLFSWYNSFLAVLNAKKASPLLTARFFKSLNELQLIGMVSEFGRSRRKRKFVDRFNITDSLLYEP